MVKNYFEIVRKLFEPVSDTFKISSENLIKTITETSFKNNEELKKINNGVLEILNDRGKLESYLLSPLSKITNPENTSQFKLVKLSNSNRVNDLLRHNTRPVTLYNNSLTFRDQKRLRFTWRPFENDN